MSNHYLRFQYRDSDNYKQHGSFELTGPLTDEQAMLIVDTLDQGEYFIPEQVGASPLPYSTSGTDADHPWHEFVALADLDVYGVRHEDYPEDYNFGPFTPEELVAAFQKAKADGWKDVSDADLAANATAELIAKIAGWLTTDEVLATTDNPDTRLELDQEDMSIGRDLLNTIIIEARAIRDGK